MLRTARRAPASRASRTRPLPLVLALLLLSTGLVGASPATALPAATAAAAPTVDRLSGPDRYSTSAAISRASFSPGVAVAYVATGATYPDALTGGAVAGRDGAPILLVRRGGIPDPVATELARLLPERIVVLGGPASVSDEVAAALEGYATTGSVTRVGGASRYEVAAALSRDSYSAGVANVYVATGSKFPDALSGSAVAGLQGVPLLLVNSGIPTVVRTELSRLRPTKITVLGGTASVSTTVANALEGYTTSGTVTRIGGADRFEVSAKVSSAAVGSASRVFVATGYNFPDALSGAPVAAGARGPVLLARTGCVPPPVLAEINRLAPSRVTLLGGTSSLSSKVASLTECSTLPGDVCTNPSRVLSGPPSSGYSTQGYYVHNNMWNTSYSLGPETLAACSYRSWYVTSRQTNHAGAVLTYPNVHKDYTDWAGYEGPRVSSFKSLTSRFAAKGPKVGIYNVAYDLWLNGVADGNSTEVMIWTENYRQVPAGSKVTSASFGGRTYDVWKTSDNRYIAFVPRTVMYSGTLDLLAMLKWLQGRGWLSSTATLGQVCFGVEVVHTGGTTARWDVTDFNISDS